MAQKLYLVPSDKYQHMIASNQQSSSSTALQSNGRGFGSGEADSLLSYTLGEMKKYSSNGNSKKTRAGSRAAADIRQALFNQALHRFLQQLRHLRDKPTRVELVEGGITGHQKLVESQENEALNTKVPLYTPPVIPVDPPIEKAAAPNAQVKTPVKKSRGVRIEEHKTNQQQLEQQIQDFINQVWNRRAALDIADSGAILNKTTREPIFGSNYKNVVKHMLYPIGLEPPGNALLYRITSHPELGIMFKNLKKQLPLLAPRQIPKTPPTGKKTLTSKSDPKQFRPHNW